MPPCKLLIDVAVVNIHVQSTIYRYIHVHCAYWYLIQHLCILNHIFILITMHFNHKTFCKKCPENIIRNKTKISQVLKTQHPKSSLQTRSFVLLLLRWLNSHYDPEDLHFYRFVLLNGSPQWWHTFHQTQQKYEHLSH